MRKRFYFIDAILFAVPWTIGVLIAGAFLSGGDGIGVIATLIAVIPSCAALVAGKAVDLRNGNAQ